MTCEATKRPRSVWVSLHFGRFPIKPPVTPVGQGKGLLQLHGKRVWRGPPYSGYLMLPIVIGNKMNMFPNYKTFPELDDGKCYVTLPYLLGKPGSTVDFRPSSWHQLASAGRSGSGLKSPTGSCRAKTFCARICHTWKESWSPFQFLAWESWDVSDIVRHCQTFQEYRPKALIFMMCMIVFIFWWVRYIEQMKDQFMIFRQESKSEATLAWSSNFVNS